MLKMISINTNKVLNAPELHISIFAFLLNFVWELLQMPLFAGFADFQYYQTILHCMKATFGDVVISLVAFAGACLITRSRMWIILMNKSGVVVFLAIGLVITILFELLATGPLNRWEYDELMPMVPVIGVGASPVAQWVILPLLQLWFVKRQIIGGGVIGA
ncbi:MAG: hypothetical protein V3T19_06295 [Acidiferrobacterales bacterium]